MTNLFVWFAVTFWVYLETKSVIATSIRGIALLFIVAGLIGLIVTLLAMRSHLYRVLSQNYQNHSLEAVLSE